MVCVRKEYSHLAFSFYRTPCNRYNRLSRWKMLAAAATLAHQWTGRTSITSKQLYEQQFVSVSNPISSHLFPTQPWFNIFSLYPPRPPNSLNEKLHSQQNYDECKFKIHHKIFKPSVLFSLGKWIQTVDIQAAVLFVDYRAYAMILKQ